MKKIIIAILAMSACIAAGAQSKLFKLGQSVEVNTAILQELNRSYVDTLPVSKMTIAGINAMLETLDPYTIYVPEEENENFEMMIGKTYGGIGAIIYKPRKEDPVLINEPYADSPAVRGGLQCGDAILAIDGLTTIGLTAAESSEKMKGKPGTQVTFHVCKVRTGEIKDITITRERIHIPDIEYAGLLDGTKTGYIRIGGFTEGLGADFRGRVKELRKQGMDKLVVDLRGNGGGLMNEAVNIVSAFVPKGSLVVSSKGNDLIGEQKFSTTMEPLDLELPLIVMVDSGSASASEIVSGALQDMDRATIMGTRTFGKGLVQSIRPLPYNGQLKITTAKYYTPSGRCVQAIDYSHRNEDGSVGHIPDSLTHEFKTAHGRVVRDGGGITPDVKIEGKEYSRLVYSLVVNGVVEQYAMEFVKSHESIPAAKDFHFEDFDGFVEFAKGKEFDYRSSAKANFDQMKKQLVKDQLADSMKEQLDAMEKALEMDKEAFLRLKKDEIIPFIEREIAIRYWYQVGGVEVDLRYDDALRTALSSPLI
jgi:carboxyl-terminal processing protease